MVNRLLVAHAFMLLDVNDTEMLKELAKLDHNSEPSAESCCPLLSGSLAFD
jgi:hypothetical protein